VPKNLWSVLNDFKVTSKFIWNIAHV
jgi:hypothetical protein